MLNSLTNALWRGVPGLLLAAGLAWAGSTQAAAPAVTAHAATHTSAHAGTHASTQAGTPAAGPRLAPDIERVLARKELVVAMLATDSPPFFYVRDGRLQGLDVDMAHELGQALGVPVRFDRSPGSFNAVVEAVSRGEADVGISKLSRTLARAKSVRFSEPYLTLRHSLLLNRSEFARLARDRSAAATVQDFRGTLGVIARSSFQDFAARNFPQAQVVLFDHWDGVVSAVQAGTVVAGYRDELEVKRVLAASPSLALSLRSVTLTDLPDAISIAVGAEAPGLHEFINLFLATRKTKLGIEEVLKAIPPTDRGAKT